VRYTGSFHIIEELLLDDDYAGFIFGYQDNRYIVDADHMIFIYYHSKFYACIWKRNIQALFTRSSPRPYGLRGIHLKVVYSSTGPGYQLRDALWHTGTTAGQAQILWHEPSLSWNFSTTYHWDLLYNPSNGLIRIQWFKVSARTGAYICLPCFSVQGSDLIADSKELYDTTHHGGRLGTFVFSQALVLFSNLETMCLQVRMCKFSCVIEIAFPIDG